MPPIRNTPGPAPLPRPLTTPAGVATSTPGTTSTPSPSSNVTTDVVDHQPSSPRHVPVERGNSHAQTREVLQTFFAPYDDPIQQDLACIREVVEARKADPRAFVEGENPYKIQYAVYNLRNPAVVAALKEAHLAGVDVQILIEQHQLDAAKTWNTADEELKAAGFDFAASHKGLTAAQRKELDLIGIQGSGLMHLKSRIFSRPDPAGGPPVEKLLTGSMNPGDEAAGNNETLHLITDPQLIARYKAKYQSVLEDKPLANEWKEGAPVNVLFTPATQGPQAADKILELIDQEKEAIFMTVFSLRNITSPRQRESMIDKLKKAKERGVEVVIITDRKQSDGIGMGANGGQGYNDKTEDLVKAAGIPVYECVNPAGPFNAMHQKNALFGLTNMKVVTDCGNWTEAALGSHKKKAVNDESFLFVDSKKLDNNATGLRYLSNFLVLLRQYENQQEDAPKAGALVEKFTKLPGWPKVTVNFDAVARTHFGQEVYITGNHEALGNWTRSGPGLKMNTTGGTYPLWQADTSVALPFGISLEYKVVKRNEHGELQWEGGENQLLVVDSGDLRVKGADQRGNTLKVDTRFRE
ncbi:MAG: phospholipase D-like domain-containing protein [Myxococcota bacterium]